MSDYEPDPAVFELRPVQRNEVVEGDPRTLALSLGRGNHAYIFTLTEDEATELAWELIDELPRGYPYCVGGCR